MHAKKQTETGKQIDLSALQRLLLIQTDNKIGDMVVATCLFSPLLARYPNLEIDVLATPTSAPVLRNHPAVTRVHIYNKHDCLGMPALVWQLRQRHFDLSINFGSYCSSTARWLTLLCGATHHLGFNKAGIAPYSISLPDDLPYGHITLKHQSVLRRLEAADTIAYHLPLSAESLYQAEQRWTEKQNPRRILINFFGSCPSKTLSDSQAVWLLQATARNLPDSSILVAVPPGKKNSVETILHQAKTGIALEIIPDLLDFAAIIATADLVVTPDTSVVHLASALGKPQLALYSDQTAFIQWGPNSPHAKSLYCEQNFSCMPEYEIEVALQTFARNGTFHD